LLLELSTCQEIRIVQFFFFFAFIESSVVFLQAARMAGWLPDPSEKRFPKTSQVGFGLVLGSDGKQF
jgi:hypothetical protein